MQLQWKPIENQAQLDKNLKEQGNYWVNSTSEAMKSMLDIFKSPQDYYREKELAMTPSVTDLVRDNVVKTVQTIQSNLAKNYENFTPNTVLPSKAKVSEPNVIEPDRDYYIKQFTELGNKFGYSPQQIAMGLAQLEGESNFKPVDEYKFTFKNLKAIQNDPKTPYLSLRRKLLKMTDDQIKAMRDDDKLYFNTFYGGRMGNNDLDEGYIYRGRGLIGLTGKDNYRRIGKKLNIDLVSNPELVNDPKYAAQIAFEFLKDTGIFNAKNIDEMTRLVHGSSNNHVTNARRAKAYEIHLANLLNSSEGK